MGCLSPFVKNSLEWKDIQEQRHNGHSLRDRATNGDGLDISTSRTPQVLPKYDWVPSGLSKRLGLSVTKFYSDQQQSLLLSRLPKEIRISIWGYVVGSHDVSIIRKINKLSHAIFPMDTERVNKAALVSTRKSWIGPLGYEKRYKATEKMSELDMLRLLRTCKQIYLEALHILYSQTSFKFHTMEAFYRFLLLSPLNGLQSIRYLTIQWSGFAYWSEYQDQDTGEPLHEHDESWQEICDAIAAMDNLKSLSIVVPSGIDNNFRGVIAKKHDVITRISLPLTALPEHVDFTFAIPEDQIRPHSQALLVERGCRNLRLVGLDSPVGFRHNDDDPD
ncbi:hypothetical protein CEP54_007242 [Fusarium duplospermum]|uniref:DUF7730 domain-containing protein n=1 Tax=Fusarium duplospermum TaxID=1325734 RepID=A0A428Q2Q5_9HYPO|nr:hypothetical protein CEP54_007242 [Fusarium duplospermum]